MQIDYIMNGRGIGGFARQLLASRMDFGALRPFIGEDGNNYVTLTRPEERTIVTNAPALLTGEEWKYIDQQVLEESLPEMRLWGDVVGAGLTFNLPNPMGTTVVSHRTRTRIGEATFSMDGLRKTKRDRPEGDWVNIPIPIVHGDFGFSLREVEVSRNGMIPLDLSVMRDEVRACAEAVEKLTWGTISSYSYGGGTIYGVTNHPDRITMTITLPTDPSWTPQLHLDEINSAMQQLDDLFLRKGPVVAYYSPGWTKYLSSRFSSAYEGGNLRRAVQEADIAAVRKADYLSNYQVVLIVFNRDFVEAIEGIPLTPIEHASGDGFELNYKVFGIMVPRVRADAAGNAGIVHMVAA